MIFSFSLQNLAIRLIILIFTIIVLLFLVRAIIIDAAVGMLSFEKLDLYTTSLQSVVDYIPNSAKMLARLADSELSDGEDLESAEQHAQKAISLSPNIYKYRLLLASIKDTRGDQAGAEQVLKEALEVAPNYSEVHWRIANLLIREGKIKESLNEFQIATKLNPNLVPAALDLVWSTSGQDVTAVRSIIKDNPKSEIKLARFLANQSHIPEAAEVFAKVDRNTVLSSPDISSFFDTLIKKGFPGIAFNFWNQLMEKNNDAANPATLWNGDFENIKAANQPAQFDWQLVSNSGYAKINIVNSGHSGKNSLEINFLGRDTTRLDAEIRHIIVLQPGEKYQLEFFVKTGNLVTSEGPRVVITDSDNKEIAASEPISAGTGDWKSMSVKFTAPPKGSNDAAVLFVSVKRKPRFSYDEPTKGIIWLDDFTVTSSK